MIACITSVYTTAFNPPAAVYNPAKRPSATMVFQMGISGKNTFTTIAPAYKPPAVSTIMLKKMVMTEKYLRDLVSNRRSKNSGMVVILDFM